MHIQDRIRRIREQQALAILDVLEAAGKAGRDVCLKYRADGFHVVSESATLGDHKHVGVSVADALGQYTMTVGAQLGLVFGSSELDDELGEDASSIVVVPEPIVEFAEPIDVQSDEYSYALSTTTRVRDTEPPPRIFCVVEDCEDAPEAAGPMISHGLCQRHLAEAQRSAELDAFIGCAVGDAQ